jgi:hypothetical protein
MCGVAVVVALAGCDTQTPCEVRPTTMVAQSDGTLACFEADGERCDDDPCDTDDDHKTTGPVKPKATSATTRKK